MTSRATFLLGGLGLAILLGAGCDSGGDSLGGGGVCASSCKKVYDCGFYVLAKDGSALDEAGCVSSCEDDATSQKAARCVDALSGCSAEAIQQCVNEASTPDDDDTPADDDDGGAPANHTSNRGGTLHGTSGDCDSCHDGATAPLCSRCHGG